MKYLAILPFHLFLVLLALTPVCGTDTAVAAEGDDSPPMEITIDVRDLPRRLVEAELTLPIEPSDQPQTLALWYPKWVPGSHGPGGPVANVAGLQIRGSDGETLTWKRTPGEVYRLEVEVPGGETGLQISLRYITDQPTTTSFGHDCFGSNHLGIVSPGALLLYPEGIQIDDQSIQLNLQLPRGWKSATALPRAEEDDEQVEQNDTDQDTDHSKADSSDADSFESVHVFQAVSLRTFVDSPIMCGKHYRSFDLVERTDICPPHTLHVFADDEKTLALNPKVIDGYRAMVTQTALLIGSHPFDRFDVLLAVTDSLPKNGLEHARSTFNVLPPGSLRSPGALKGWDRLLVPHEYLHAWCGKYRRPMGMLTKDFHHPKDTELLWVYEGLTQYLGELVEARSGMMSADEFRHRLLVELRNATHQQGRRWRSLADTAAASHILRAASPNWSGLRRSQDYYMEGMLFWLEADAQIRKLTDGKRSLDDFCHIFFEASRDTTVPKAFDRDEIVNQLQAVAEFDWDGLIARRVESLQQQFDPAAAELLGYTFRFRPARPEIPANTFRHSSGIDLLDSLGVSFTGDGSVRRVLLGSPADRARLAPGVEVIGIGNHKWSGERMVEAVRHSTDRQPIELLVARGEELQPVQIHYYDGLRYWNLERDSDRPDRLAEILAPK